MIKRIKNILIVTNFPESSANAVDAAIAMCKRHQASLHLLHVRPANRTVIPPGKNARLFEEVMEAYNKELKTLQLQARKVQEEKNIPCYFHISDGPLWRGISATAEDFHCDLIILEKSAERHYPASGTSVLYRILQAAKCPVLTLPCKAQPRHFKRILIPMKASYADLKKLEIALPIIEKNQAEVLLFGSVSVQSEVRDIFVLNRLLSTADDLINRNKAVVKRETFLSKSQARQVLNKAAEKNSDLIIISNKPKTGIRNIFSKNTLERIVDRSVIPVLTVMVDSPQT